MKSSTSCIKHPVSLKEGIFIYLQVGRVKLSYFVTESMHLLGWPAFLLHPVNLLCVHYDLLLFAGALSFLNGYNVKATIKLQNVFMFCKIAALVVVILIGVVWMSLGNVENFKNSFEGTTTNPGKIAKAFYSGIFSYSGWYVLR